MALVGPILAALAILAIGTVVGILPVKKLIEIKEARHELRQGSASFIRGVAGWGIALIWLVAIWYAATIVGDWGVTGDLEGAIERSGKRLEIILHLLAALGDG